MRTQDAIRVRKLATERGLTSGMSDTKWSELWAAFRQRARLPPARVKDLPADDDYVSDWSSDWEHLLAPYVSIQWFEMELPPSEVPEAVALCKKVGAAVEVTEAGVRVWGWFGSLDRPQFA
jgi:hypothetical protein